MRFCDRLVLTTVVTLWFAVTWAWCIPGDSWVDKWREAHWEALDAVDDVLTEMMLEAAESLAYVRAIRAEMELVEIEWESGLFSNDEEPDATAEIMIDDVEEEIPQELVVVDILDEEGSEQVKREEQEVEAEEEVGGHFLYEFDCMDTGLAFSLTSPITMEDHRELCKRFAVDGKDGLLTYIEELFSEGKVAVEIAPM